MAKRRDAACSLSEIKGYIKDGSGGKMGALLLIPFVLIRFLLLSRLDPSAIRRAAHFPPIKNKEKLAYWLYQLSNIVIFIYLFFLQIKGVPRSLLVAGVIVFLAGNLLLIISVANFAAPAASGINQKGLYRFSRNPMYVAYFVYFLGCVLLTQSPVLLVVVLLFQVTAHWIILAEERWCAERFGAEYIQYAKKVRRYL